MSETTVRVPISTIIRLALDTIRSRGDKDPEEIMHRLHYWDLPCQECGIPFFVRVHDKKMKEGLNAEEKRKWHEEMQNDPPVRDKDLTRCIVGKVYTWEGKDYLTISNFTERVKRETQHIVGVAPAEHFIYDIELSPYDYEELAQNIHGGWAAWMGILERCKSGGRVPRFPPAS